MTPPDDIIIKRVLNNKGTAKEAESVAAWLATEEGQRWLATAIEKDAYDIRRGYLPLQDSQNADEVLRQILKKIKTQRRRRIIWSIAAVFIPVVCVISAWITIDKKTGGALTQSERMELVKVDNGEQRDVYFQDGTSIKMNSGSEMSFPRYFGLKSREVHLKGEALFNVAHNNKRPFIVHLDNNMSVEVKGTVFNINTYRRADIIFVDLYEGSVVFHDGDKHINMLLEQTLSYNIKTRKGTLSKLNYSKEDTPWVNGILLFRDTPLSEMVEILQRQYGVVIDVSPKAAKNSYSMKTDPGTPIEDVLRDLQIVSSVKVTKISDTHYSIQ